MKRFDYRLIIGAALVAGGILMLLDRSGILKGATNFFWGAIFAIGAAIFLYWFFTERARWWAAIPGFTLAGMAISSLLIEPLGLSWGGAAFLAGIGVGFLAIYVMNQRQWWAIIPGGVLITMAVTSALSSAYHVGDTGGVFLVGLGLTFLLLGVLAKLKWAYIPAAALLLLGFFIGTPFIGGLEYAWIAILLIAGAVLVVSAIRAK